VRSKWRSVLLDYLLLLPGVGYIIFFISAAVIVTALQSVGLFSITGDSGFTLKDWRILASKEVLDSLLFSLKMGIGSSIGTIVVAFPVALYLRKPSSLKTGIGSVMKIPLFIPALVATFLIVNLISYDGLVNDALTFAHILRKPARMLNDKQGVGVVVIQIWKNLPFVLLIISASVASIRDDTIDAARNLGAGRLAVVRLIYVPLAMPGILVSMILMFIKAFGDYPITSIEGPIYPSSMAVRMYTTANLYHDWNQAAVVGMIIIVSTVFVVAGYSKLAGLVVRD
jgi:putative spermidine/putrescine transport system permease protein